MAKLQTAPEDQATAAVLGAMAQPPGAGALPVAPKRRGNPAWQRGVSANPAGRPKGLPNRVHQTIKDAIEQACAPGACHPQGLAGWLIERAQGNVQDRQIFAGLVAKVLPAQLQASVQHQGVVVQLGWLQGRSVGRNGTSTAQSDIIDAQVLDVPTEKQDDRRVTHTTSAPEGGGGEGGDASAATHPDPHPPQNPAAGGSGE